MIRNAPGPIIRSCAHRPAHGGIVPAYLTVLTGAFRRRPAAGVMAVSVNQTIVFWDRKAREMLGYTAHRLVGAKCSEIPSGLGRSGLTPECAGCCACMRYARAGLVPPAVELAMRASWGEVKWLDVRPVVVPWLPDVGTVVVYLFRERVTDAAQPLGDLVVVVQDDEAEPLALTEVTDEPDVQRLTPRELEVLRLMALGWETKYIAEELSVSWYTARNHIENLRKKLGASSRLEAVMVAMRLGILPSE